MFKLKFLITKTAKATTTTTTKITSKEKHFQFFFWKANNRMSGRCDQKPSL
jgi:hypothetical protein